MKKDKIIIIGIVVALAVGVSSYLYLNIYGKVENDTTVRDTLNTDKQPDMDEDMNIVTPIITTTPKTTQTPRITPTPEITPIPDGNELSIDRYAVAMLVDGEKKYGYITEQGKLIIKPQYNYASDFNNGVAIVSKNDIFCLIDIDENILFTSGTVIGEFKNGAASFSKQVGDDLIYGYIDTSGKIIVEPQYKYAYDFNEEEQAYVQLLDGTYAHINTKGQILTSYDFKSKYSYIYQIADGYVIYRDSITGKYGVDDIVSGEVIYEPIYSFIKYLGHDLFAMKAPELEAYDISNLSPSALFNKEGEQLTPYELYDITQYNGEYASVTDSTSTYFIGIDGKEITTLPKFLGRGTLVMLGDVVKADLDGDISYYTKEGKIIYQSKNEFNLGTGIIVKEMKFKANKFVLVRYPRIEGLKNIQIQEQINQELETLFTQYRKDVKEEDGLTVDDSFIPTLKKNLLTISMRGYDFSFGAAHGMPLMEYYYIDINTGKFYQLSDLFKSGDGYQTKINNIISEEIEKRMNENEDFFFSDAFTGIQADHDFVLTDKSIIIYFYPYDIASYAQGFPEFEIPFTELIDVIDRDSDFYKAFH